MNINSMIRFFINNTKAKNYMNPLALLSYILILSCSVKNVKNNYSDYDIIYEKIIDFNHLKAKKADSNKAKISSTLIAIEINFNMMDEGSFENYFLPIGPDGKPDSKAEKFLFKQDYKDFVFQYNDNKVTEVSKITKEKYRNSKLSKITRDKKNRISYEYLEFSKPFFSHDKQTAYIEVNYYSGIYGDGTAYILKKNNGIWQIVQRNNLWIT